MPVEVNTAALEAVLDAAEDQLKMRQALHLDTQVWVLGDDTPCELEACIDMLKRALGKESDRMADSARERERKRKKENSAFWCLDVTFEEEPDDTGEWTEDDERHRQKFTRPEGKSWPI
jgi:hypothetical protein